MRGTKYETGETLIKNGAKAFVFIEKMEFPHEDTSTDSRLIPLLQHKYVLFILLY